MAGNRPRAVYFKANSPKAAADKSAFTSRVKSSRDFGPAIEKPVRVEATERTKTSAGGAHCQNQRRGNFSAKPEPTIRKRSSARQAIDRAPTRRPAGLRSGASAGGPPRGIRPAKK